MVRFLLLIALFILLLIGIGFAWGSSLPREHVAASRITLATPIDQVWPVVRNPAALRGTWPALTHAERIADLGGRETWAQTLDGDPLRLQITEASPPTRLVTTIVADAEALFGGSWTYELRPAEGGGTHVTLTEHGWIESPLFRVMGRMFGLHRTLEGYLHGLGSHFGEGVRPERVAGR